MTNINLPDPVAADLLARHALLRGLPPLAAAEVAAYLVGDAVPLRAEAGQTLFGEGDVARHYVLVGQGQAEVMRLSLIHIFPRRKPRLPWKLERSDAE